MMTCLTNVFDQHRSWEGNGNGPLDFIKGTLEDGTVFELGVKPANTAARKAELKALIGQRGEFEVEPKADYQGQRQCKLKGWPGKAAAFGGKGAGGPAASFKNTEAGQRNEQWSISRAVAIKAAVDWMVGSSLKPTDPENRTLAIELADDFAEWLSQPCPQSATPTATAPADPTLVEKVQKAKGWIGGCQTMEQFTKRGNDCAGLLQKIAGTPLHEDLVGEINRVHSILEAGDGIPF